MSALQHTRRQETLAAESSAQQMVGKGLGSEHGRERQESGAEEEDEEEDDDGEDAEDCIRSALLRNEDGTPDFFVSFDSTSREMLQHFPNIFGVLVLWAQEHPAKSPALNCPEKDRKNHQQASGRDKIAE